MIIKNARVFTEDGSFMQGDVVVKDGRFDSVLERTAEEWWQGIYPGCAAGMHQVLS